MNYPCIIVEVPHQMPATAWTCPSLDSLYQAAMESAGDNYEWPDEPTEGELCEGLTHDLSRSYFFDKAAEAKEALDADFWHAHQWVKCISETKREALSLGWTQEEIKEGEEYDELSN